MKHPFLLPPVRKIKTNMMSHHIFLHPNQHHAIVSHQNQPYYGIRENSTSNGSNPHT